jgi:ribosome-associated protein
LYDVYVHLKRRSTIEAVELARDIAEISAEMLAADITLLDISELSSFADVFIVTTADNMRQLRALQREVVGQMRERGVRPRRVEGELEGGWIVLDYGDVIVHLLTRDQREFYRLEDLSIEAPVLLKIQ